MAYDDLRDWIKTLEKAGELKRITAEVSPELEITEITDRVSKIGAPGSAHPKGKAPTKTQYTPGGPALLFENIKGHPGHKVLINQFGSERRMAMSLGVDSLDEIADRIKGLINIKAPEGLLQRSHPPRRRHRRPEISRSPNLAAGRRPLHHTPLRHHPRSQVRQAQRRHVPYAGLRRQNHRDALAAAEGGGRAYAGPTTR